MASYYRPGIPRPAARFKDDYLPDTADYMWRCIKRQVRYSRKGLEEHLRACTPPIEPNPGRDKKVAKAYLRALKDSAPLVGVDKTAVEKLVRVIDKETRQGKDVRSLALVEPQVLGRLISALPCVAPRKHLFGQSHYQRELAVPLRDCTSEASLGGSQSSCCRYGPGYSLWNRRILLSSFLEKGNIAVLDCTKRFVHSLPCNVLLSVIRYKCVAKARL
jgi:hypothetical protein